MIIEVKNGKATPKLHKADVRAMLHVIGLMRALANNVDGADGGNFQDAADAIDSAVDNYGSQYIDRVTGELIEVGQPAPDESEAPRKDVAP